MTTAVAPLDLKQWFAANVRDFLCLNPVSISPQPVHALSMFMARVTEIRGQRRLSDLAKVVATKNGLWAVSDEDLRSQVRYQLPASDSDLEQLRHALAGLLAADRAVFHSTYSFQLAHIGLANSDRTDHYLGVLASRLVLSRPDGREALTAVIDRLFERQRNPHWAIASILIGTQRSDVDVAPPISPPPWADSPACKVLARECGDLLIRALALVAYGRDTLLGLRVLATTLTWVGLLVYAQVPTLVTDGHTRTLLAEAGDPGQLPGLRDASASSRRALNGAWEGWLAQQLAETVKDLYSEKEPADPEMREFLRACSPYSLSGGSQTTKERSPEVYASWREHHATFPAAGYTLEDMLAASMGNKPQRWFDAVGRHCGFVGPRRGHPSRFRSEVSLLPTLILAGISETDGPSIAMAEWLERLISRFGIVFGPHWAARTMPDRAPEEDLEHNRDLLSEMLASVGLARRYSDGLTEILNLSTLWRRVQ
jgi:hypothetical protein